MPFLTLLAGTALAGAALTGAMLFAPAEPPCPSLAQREHRVHHAVVDRSAEEIIHAVVGGPVGHLDGLHRHEPLRLQPVVLAPAPGLGLHTSGAARTGTVLRRVAW